MTHETAERWHTQSILGGGDVPPDERGDCVRACITSILGLPLDAIENVHGENWWDRLNAEVAKHGYTLVIVWLDFAPPAGYWIASVPSLSLGPEPDGSQALHAVVCRGYELVHDPAMKRRYTDGEWVQAWNDGKVAEGWALMPLDPLAAGAGS